MKLLRAIRKINDAAVILLIATLTVVVITQVIARYVFNNSLSWSEEIARYTQIWMVMLGSAVVMRHREHLAIDILTAAFPKKMKFFTDLLVFVIVLIFFGLVAYYGVAVTANAARQISPAVGLKMSYVYAALPVGATLILLETLLLTIEHIKYGLRLFKGQEGGAEEKSEV